MTVEETNEDHNHKRRGKKKPKGKTWKHGGELAKSNEVRHFSRGKRHLRETVEPQDKGGTEKEKNPGGALRNTSGAYHRRVR